MSWVRVLHVLVQSYGFSSNFSLVKRYATFHTNFRKLKGSHRKRILKILKNSVSFYSKGMQFFTPNSANESVVIEKKIWKILKNSESFSQKVCNFSHQFPQIKGVVKISNIERFRFAPSFNNQ